MRQLLRDFAFAGLVVLAACSGASTEVATDQDALDAPALFQRVADDALAAGADPSVVRAYRELGVVSMHGRVSPVSIPGRSSRSTRWPDPSVVGPCGSSCSSRRLP